MKGVLLSVLLAGCAREPWRRTAAAALVPALELRVAYRRAEDSTHAHADVGIGARLRWTARSAASAVPSQIEQSPASWIAPCALDDSACLVEVAENEAEIQDALRETPH